MSGRRLAVALTSALILGGISTAAAPAQAESSSLAQISNFINKVFGKCLDSNANGSVYMQTCNGGAYQKWEWVVGGANSGKMLKNRATGRCLAFVSTGTVSTKTCSSNNFYQSWYYHTGTYRLLGGGYTNAVTSLKLQGTTMVNVRVIPDTPPLGQSDTTMWDVLATGS